VKAPKVEGIVEKVAEKKAKAPKIANNKVDGKREVKVESKTKK
jgi:hypothetical protein